MKCVNLRYRSEKYKKYMYCMVLKTRIHSTECSNCGFKQFKEIKHIKAKTSRLKQKEDNRFSILQLNTNHCFNCGKYGKLDKHEAIGGMNRQKSIEYGLIFYLCRECHMKTEENQQFKNELQIIAQNKFIEKYSYDKFMEEFKKNYNTKE